MLAWSQRFFWRHQLAVEPELVGATDFFGASAGDQLGALVVIESGEIVDVVAAALAEASGVVALHFFPEHGAGEGDFGRCVHGFMLKRFFNRRFRRWTQMAEGFYLRSSA